MKITHALALAYSFFLTTKPTESVNRLEKYKTYLEDGTYNGQDWSKLQKKPQSRYHTFKTAFDHFEKNKGKIVVELGTTHSFVDGRYPGCDKDDTKYWNPNDPTQWDWGAGCFTLMAAECLSHLQPQIYTVDLDASAIHRCQIMTKEYNTVKHHRSDSELFLKKFTQKIDLLYLDTGYMNPIEPTAQLQLREARVVVEQDLISENGLILIDDVRNQNVIGDKSGLGKSKYAIPYFLENGFEIVEDEYQVILRKSHKS
ncbi:hypothetical protein E3J61_01735 [Candidatus Dependentiae bacterium]|nr:MAG: hypothetical protein E3J61_01735 [Candidatus Dependentiae bacterium]